MDAALVVALMGVVLSLGTSALALRTATVAVRAAGRAGDATEVRLDRIAHQLAALNQAWYWTPEWQAGEAEADADLAAGRFVRFYSAEAMDAHLAGIPLPEQAQSGSDRPAG
ncbi:MAG: hypothetical protein ABR608_13510 [Pseudonocardiaceae bacterium]